MYNLEETKVRSICERKISIIVRNDYKKITSLAIYCTEYLALQNILF